MHGRQFLTAVILVGALLTVGERLAQAGPDRSRSGSGPVVFLPIEPAESVGQWSGGRPPVQAVQDSPVGPAFPAHPAPLRPVGGSVSAPDYWIVSSRRCAQSGRPQCPGGALDYFHVGAVGHPLPSDERSFQGWLVPGVPVCLVVHGSFTTWNDAVYGSRMMYEWLRGAAPERPLQMVFFTWPSDSDAWWLLPHVSVGVLGRRAEFNGFYVADLITRIPADHPISLFGHSHGARVVMSAVHLQAGGTIQELRLWNAGADPRRYRVMLAAAALDQHWLSPGGRYVCAWQRIGALVNLRNRNDIALAIYPLRRICSGLALGRSGFRRLDWVAFRRFGMPAAELDVSHLLDTGHLWDNYYRRPEIARSIVPYAYYTDLSGRFPALEPWPPLETAPPAWLEEPLLLP